MESADKRLDGVITDEEVARATAEIAGTAEPITEEEVLQAKEKASPMAAMFRRMAKRDVEEREKEKQARALSEGFCRKMGMKSTTPTKSTDPAKDAFARRILEGEPAKERTASLSEAMCTRMGTTPPAKEKKPASLSEAFKRKCSGGDFENYRPHVKRRPVG